MFCDRTVSELNRRSLLFVLAKIDEIRAPEQTEETERDTTLRIDRFHGFPDLYGLSHNQAILC